MVGGVGSWVAVYCCRLPPRPSPPPPLSPPSNWLRALPACSLIGRRRGGVPVPDPAGCADCCLLVFPPYTHSHTRTDATHPSPLQTLLGNTHRHPCLLGISLARGGRSRTCCGRGPGNRTNCWDQTKANWIISSKTLSDMVHCWVTVRLLYFHRNSFELLLLHLINVIWICNLIFKIIFGGHFCQLINFCLIWRIHVWKTSRNP